MWKGLSLFRINRFLHVVFLCFRQWVVSRRKCFVFVSAWNGRRDLRTISVSFSRWSCITSRNLISQHKAQGEVVRSHSRVWKTFALWSVQVRSGKWRHRWVQDTLRRQVGGRLIRVHMGAWLCRQVRTRTFRSMSSRLSDSGCGYHLVSFVALMESFDAFARVLWSDCSLVYYQICVSFFAWKLLCQDQMFVQLELKKFELERSRRLEARMFQDWKRLLTLLGRSRCNLKSNITVARFISVVKDPSVQGKKLAIC
uniref:Uncharacterized protein n=1 Tax=Hanusia phi TaxID=3032 RepID=A0A7S0F0Q9_9CRYP|mmetsp:Transcript_33362/g.74797  ORF Transcript_33362/g.74797 Transcript_33362/m.74797 type:complete len:255 (+) Transcript_33362:11-775(+)